MHADVTREPTEPPGGGGDSYGPIRGVLLELLSALDSAAAGSPRDFFDRICRGVCELTPITRCALLLYDEREKRVMPAGSHGIDDEILSRLNGTLEETPIAALALAEDRVVVTSALSRAIPERHRGLPGVETLACVPIAAGERWLGVMLCDRGGGELRARAAPQPPDVGARQDRGARGEHAARLRPARAREAAGRAHRPRPRGPRPRDPAPVRPLARARLGRRRSAGEQQRAADEMRSALDDLRTAMQRTGEPPQSRTERRPSAPRSSGSRPTTRLSIAVDRRRGGSRRPRLEALAQSVLAEALRNAAKHARPERDSWSRRAARRRHLRAGGSQRRRRARAAPAAPGMGLRLAALEAIQRRRLSSSARSRRRPPGGCGSCVPLERAAPSGSAAWTRSSEVLVVDDHDVVHWGFKLLLGKQSWVERCLAARSAEEALDAPAPQPRRTSRSSTCSSASESGAELCEAIRASRPRRGVLLISGAGTISPAAAKAAGASGLRLQGLGAPPTSAMAVRMVALGMTVFEPAGDADAPELSRARARGPRR